MQQKQTNQVKTNKQITIKENPKNHNTHIPIRDTHIHRQCHENMQPGNTI